MLGNHHLRCHTPKTTKQTDMRVFDELHFLEIFFQDVHRKGHTDVVKLYETVQHAGNVLTRLYVFQVARRTHACTRTHTVAVCFAPPPAR